jgi:DNA-binding transcriptional MerR regulator
MTRENHLRDEVHALPASREPADAPPLLEELAERVNPSTVTSARQDTSRRRPPARSGSTGPQTNDEDKPRVEALSRSQRDMTEPGFRGPTVIKLVGITYRQLDYWARTGLVTPSVRAADRSGTQRLYSFTDVVELRIIKRLLDANVSLRQIRSAIGYLRKESGGKPLSDITLMSDGNRIYACHSNEEVVSVLSHGQAVFGIAVGRVWTDTEGDLSHLPDQLDFGTEDQSHDQMMAKAAGAPSSRSALPGDQG